jgi:hypothetical protein
MAGLLFTSGKTNRREGLTNQVEKGCSDPTRRAAKAKKVFRGKSECLGPRLTIGIIRSFSQWSGVCAPAKTSKIVIDREPLPPNRTWKPVGMKATGLPFPVDAFAGRWCLRITHQRPVFISRLDGDSFFGIYA